MSWRVSLPAVDLRVEEAAQQVVAPLLLPGVEHLVEVRVHGGTDLVLVGDRVGVLAALADHHVGSDDPVLHLEEDGEVRQRQPQQRQEHLGRNGSENSRVKSHDPRSTKPSMTPVDQRGHRPLEGGHLPRREQRVARIFRGTAGDPADRSATGSGAERLPSATCRWLSRPRRTRAADGSTPAPPPSW